MTPAIVAAGVVNVGDWDNLDEFHHEGGDASAFFQAVDSRDVRVIQRREGPGFTLEAREPISVVRERLGQDLDRHVAIQPRVAGPEDLPRGPFADAGDNFVDTETGTGSKGQRWRDYMVGMAVRDGSFLLDGEVTSDSSDAFRLRARAPRTSRPPK
jgi:hypothetical protein